MSNRVDSRGEFHKTYIITLLYILFSEIYNFTSLHYDVTRNKLCSMTCGRVPAKIVSEKNLLFKRRKGGFPLQFEIIVWKGWLVSRWTRLNPLLPFHWIRSSFSLQIQNEEGPPFPPFEDKFYFHLLSLQCRKQEQTKSDNLRGEDFQRIYWVL